jgi:hypothetical protein
MQYNNNLVFPVFSSLDIMIFFVSNKNTNQEKEACFMEYRAEGVETQKKKQNQYIFLFYS